MRVAKLNIFGVQILTYEGGAYKIWDEKTRRDEWLNKYFYNIYFEGVHTSSKYILL